MLLPGFERIDSSWALVLILGVHTSRILIFFVCVVEKENFNSILPLTNVVKPLEPSE